MTTPTPAPAMTAKRLAEIARAITPYPGKELFAYIDALTARVAELEREVVDWTVRTGRQVERADRAESELAAARKVEDGEIAKAIKDLTLQEYASSRRNEIATLLIRLSAALKEAERERDRWKFCVERYEEQRDAAEARAQAAEAENKKLREAAAIPEDDDADLPTAEDVRGILAQHEGSQVMHTVSTPTTTINFNSDLSGAVLISRDGTCIAVDSCALLALFRAYLGARELKAVPRYPTEKMMEAASEPKNSDWNEIWHPMWDAAERLPAEATSLSNQRNDAPLSLTRSFDIPLGRGK